MPHYKLVYFKHRGRAENIRMAFELAGVPFEDVRLQPEAFAEIKSTTPFGQLPLLEIDGEVFAQSTAILLYVARETGLDGGSSINRLRVDMILRALGDLAEAMLVWHNENDPVKKNEIFQKYANETAPKFLKQFENTVKKNDTGFSVGSSVTVSDIALSNMLALQQRILAGCDFSKYKALLALQATVYDLPNIKAWIKKRPDDVLIK